MQVDGYVQGVGFRFWVRARAADLGLAGFARNTPDGRVSVVVEGDATACEQLLSSVSSGRTPGRVTQVTHQWEQAKGDFPGFLIR